MQLVEKQGKSPGSKEDEMVLTSLMCSFYYIFFPVVIRGSSKEPKD